MANRTHLQQEILKMLQESSEPRGPSYIAEKLGLEKNKIHYNLKKLKEEGAIQCSEEGKYSINEIESIRELANKILNLLSLKECCARELEELLGQDETKIISAISLLELDGLVKEGEISLAKRGGISKKSRTVNVIDYFKNSTYILTYLGYSKVGACPICKEKLNEYETVIVTFFKQSDELNPKPWLSAKIHSKCLSDSKAYKGTYGKYELSMFCSHCGLPLTPKMLPVRKFNYELLKDHFFVFELESINLLKSLKRSWIVSSNSPALKGETVSRPDNSTITKVYNELKIQIPGWLEERIKKDESNPEESYEDICHEISNDLIFVFKKDLSILENTERFQRLLIKYRSECPDGYNANSRIKEIWTAAREIKSNYEQNVQKYYSELLGPAANIYSCIDWVFNAKDYDFDKLWMYLPDYTNKPPIFAQTFAIKCGDKYYHPYCADKLGLNHSHCNDPNLKGGEQLSKKSDCDNHSNQCNSNNNAYWQSRGRDAKPDTNASKGKK